MKREIKFRAWTGKKMVFADLSLFIWSMGHQCAEDVSLEEEVGEEVAAFQNQETEKTIMQFTGLFCHGKAVYEGDLLERSASFGRGNVIGEVYFDEGQFRIRWTPEEKGWNNSLYLHLNDCEHKGNIYENPELL